MEVKRMKIYIAYKFKDADTTILKKKLTELSNALESAGHSTFIFFRDVQKWGAVQTSLPEVIEGATAGLKDCDMILADITEKANGVYFEMGYAKALGLRVVAMCEAGKESAFLKAAADEVVEYKDWADLIRKIRILNIE